MGSWILDMGLVFLAALAMLFVFYKLMFSSVEQARRELAAQPKPRFNRREVERSDRRRQHAAAPDGAERRTGPRR